VPLFGVVVLPPLGSAAVRVAMGTVPSGAISTGLRGLLPSHPVAALPSMARATSAISLIAGDPWATRAFS
jgi:hypothetical protein